MTDDLRTRLAKTLYQRFAPQIGLADAEWDDEHSVSQQMWMEDAEAVIRELNLQEEIRHAVVPHVGIVTVDPETFTTTGDHRQEHRHVTEWETDNDE